MKKVQNGLKGSLKILFLLLLFINPAEAYKVSEATINVNLDGSSYIFINLNFNETEGLIILPLIGEPEIFSIKIYSYNGSLIPFSLSKRNLLINLLGEKSPVKVEYITYSLTKKNGRIWNLTLNLPFLTLVQLPEGALLIGINGIPEDIYVKDNRINLLLSPKAWALSYFITLRRENFSFNPLLFLFILIPIIFLIFFLRRRRRKIVYSLRPDDERILQYLRERGEAYEGDIVKDLNLPKSSVWRAVRRLSEANLVKIEVEGRRVKVKLK
ncbi:hypothetical protein HRbin06_00590 [archaeon HR06]|nr:hypothetical protein HRbin06_00590 [archaeon HR06]